MIDMCYLFHYYHKPVTGKNWKLSIPVRINYKKAILDSGAVYVSIKRG